MITYTIETLYHFNCEECHSWFSIGDFEENIDELTCPSCGITQLLAHKELDEYTA